MHTKVSESHGVAMGHHIPTNPGIRFSSGQTVLVVDDAVVNRQVAEATLQRFGLDVTLATNAQGHFTVACRATSGGADGLRMPGISGLEATKRIRAEERRGRTPIFALTADDTPDQQAACREAGMDGLIQNRSTICISAETLASVLNLETGTMNSAGSGDSARCTTNSCAQQP